MCVFLAAILFQLTSANAERILGCASWHPEIMSRTCCCKPGGSFQNRPNQCRSVDKRQEIVARNFGLQYETPRTMDATSQQLLLLFEGRPGASNDACRTKWSKDGRVHIDVEVESGVRCERVWRRTPRSDLLRLRDKYRSRICLSTPPNASSFVGKLQERGNDW